MWWRLVFEVFPFGFSARQFEHFVRQIDPFARQFEPFARPLDLFARRFKPFARQQLVPFRFAVFASPTSS